MTQLLKTNPGLLIWVLIFGMGALVCGLVGSMMVRNGASLRPVYWFAGLLLLVGAPQFLAHLYFAMKSLRSEAPRVAALEALANETDAEQRASAAKRLFGADADSDLIRDARPVFGDALAKAKLAQFASLPTGETVLLAQFNGYSEAEKAWVAYLRFTGMNAMGGKGDSERGYAVTRPSGDRAYAIPFANLLGVWTGPDDAAIRRRMLAGDFEPHRRAPLAALDSVGSERPSAQSESRHPQTAIRSGQNTQDLGTASSMSSVARGLLVTGGLAVFLLVVVAYFFKGAAWAGSSPAKPGIAPISAGELAERPETVNSLDVPFRIERGERDGEFVATWRYADAKWIDHARAHGVRRMHRIRLVLDPGARTVRVTDFSASYDWSAGHGGASVAWKAATGITFFQYEHRRVFGLQLDEQGRFKPELSYAYTFNLQEMKQPLLAAVTQGGWTWRPVVWQGPKWLRWLTE